MIAQTVKVCNILDNFKIAKYKIASGKDIIEYEFIWQTLLSVIEQKIMLIRMIKRDNRKLSRHFKAECYLLQESPSESQFTDCPWQPL